MIRHWMLLPDWSLYKQENDREAQGLGAVSTAVRTNDNVDALAGK